jgi:saccharopine dehydrogenase (NAD+, L-lysine-forming)
VRIAFVGLGAKTTQGTTRSALEAAHMGGAAFVNGELRKEPVAKHRWTVPFPEPAGTRDAISIPWGDIITAPRSTGARNVRVFLSLPKRALRWARVGARVGMLAMKLPGAAALGERWVRRQPEGPTPEQRAKAVSAIYAEAVGAKGVATAWAVTMDGYDFTAKASVHCALLAADPGFDKKGTLTPSQAFGAKALLEATATSWGSKQA